MAYKKLRDHQKFSSNPFLNDVINEIKIVRKTIKASLSGKHIQLIVDSVTGDVTGHTEFRKIVEVDEEKFIKSYISHNHFFWGLSDAATRVYGYITTVLKPDQDKFYLRMNQALKHTG
jgi:hypothetical protein